MGGLIIAESIATINLQFCWREMLVLGWFYPVVEKRHVASGFSG